MRRGDGGVRGEGRGRGGGNGGGEGGGNGWLGARSESDASRRGIQTCCRGGDRPGVRKHNLATRGRRQGRRIPVNQREDVEAEKSSSVVQTLLRYSKRPAIRLTLEDECVFV